MNPEQQRIAIAEACGWKTGYRDPEAWHPLPDYLNDLNAMHEAEKILAEDNREEYLNILYGVCNPHSMINDAWNLNCATAAQRAEAFLRTIGKWKQTK